MVDNSGFMCFENGQYENTPTRLVNVKARNLRREGYSSLEDWLKVESNVFVGKGCVVKYKGRKSFVVSNSKFSNPFKLHVDGEYEDILKKYKVYILSKLKRKEITVQELLDLKNKNLGCFCENMECHAPILLEIIGNIEGCRLKLYG